MLHRVVYVSESAGATGVSTQSLAEILGASDRNNRRDHLTGCIMFHEGRIVQAIEGGRVDIDRLIRRLLVDPRHTGMRIIVDTPISERLMHEPMALCRDPATMMRRTGLTTLSRLTAGDVQVMLDYRLAA